MGMLGAMGILKSFTDELRKVQAEREAQLLLEVLRRRLGDLTFGDLAALITSPLGKKLAAVKVSEAFAVATASAPTVVTTPAVEETRTSPADPKAAKTSSKKASKSSRAKPDRKAKGKAAKPSNPREPKAAKAPKAAVGEEVDEEDRGKEDHEGPGVGEAGDDTELRGRGSQGRGGGIEHLAAGDGSARGLRPDRGGPDRLRPLDRRGPA
jgi:hypothetical protein